MERYQRAFKLDKSRQRPGHRGGAARLSRARRLALVARLYEVELEVGAAHAAAKSALLVELGVLLPSSSGIAVAGGRCGSRRRRASSGRRRSGQGAAGGALYVCPISRRRTRGGAARARGAAVPRAGASAARRAISRARSRSCGARSAPIRYHVEAATRLEADRTPRPARTDELSGSIADAPVPNRALKLARAADAAASSTRRARPRWWRTTRATTPPR